MRSIPLPLVAFCALLAACQSETAEDPAAGQTAAEATAAVPGDTDETAAFAGIAADETFHFTGTEPFWGGEVAGVTLTYETPEDLDGTAIPIARFAGRGGASFSGLLDGVTFEMTATELECSDGMSDRTYPFTVTLEIGDEQRNGCGWTERRPFEGPEHP